MVILRARLLHSNNSTGAKTTSLSLTASGLETTACNLDSDRQREDMGGGVSFVHNSCYVEYSRVGQVWDICLQNNIETTLEL